jgi:hypothetical protein
LLAEGVVDANGVDCHAAGSGRRSNDGGGDVGAGDRDRVGVAPSTVCLTIKRLTQAGLDEAAVASINDEALQARPFSRVGTMQGHRRRIEPEFPLIYRELKRQHVMLQILWDEYDEYIERHPEWYRYSRFCDLSWLRATVASDDVKLAAIGYLDQIINSSLQLEPDRLMFLSQGSTINRRSRCLYLST